LQLPHIEKLIQCTSTPYLPYFHRKNLTVDYLAGTDIGISSRH
jgi:hypothetical protein